MSEKKKIVVIMGPTAVGKTALSIHLAQKYQGEVINGDSLQVYRHLDIGTAKVTPEETAGVPHHLIDIVDIHEPYTASDFKKAAEFAITAIHKKGKLPILVGGSGLYIQGLLYDMKFGQGGEDSDYRQKLEIELVEKGADNLWSQLEAIDPQAATNIHPNNSRRVIRALESIHVSGKPFSSQTDSVKTSKYDTLLIALNSDRQILYNRINQRVDQMVKNGLLEEAKVLYELANRELNQAHKGIGYKEWFPYFSGEISFEEASENVKQNSRRYAKRQLTWFRNRMEAVHWFDVSNDDYLEKIEQLIENFRK